MININILFDDLDSQRWQRIITWKVVSGISMPSSSLNNIQREMPMTLSSSPVS